MAEHPEYPIDNGQMSEVQIDAVLEDAKDLDAFPRIVEAVYRSEPGLDFLMLRLSNGRRLLIPKEMLGELEHATSAQAADLQVGPEGVDIWWPQLDDGLYLPDFLAHRWGRDWQDKAA